MIGTCIIAIMLSTVSKVMHHCWIDKIVSVHTLHRKERSRFGFLLQKRCISAHLKQLLLWAHKQRTYCSTNAPYEHTPQTESRVTISVHFVIILNSIFVSVIVRNVTTASPWFLRSPRCLVSFSSSPKVQVSRVDSQKPKVHVPVLHHHSLNAVINVVLKCFCTSYIPKVLMLHYCSADIRDLSMPSSPNPEETLISGLNAISCKSNITDLMTTTIQILPLRNR